MANNSFGIDLGTSKICIYNHEKKRVFVERNMIAIENKKNVIAYGDSAYEMFEKAPDNIVVSAPLNNGVISDINNMQELLKLFISEITKGNYKNSDYIMSIPHDVTDVERRAFGELIEDSSMKAHAIYVVEKSIACALGLNIDVKSSQGVMIVDVGYNTTEISILSFGGIVKSKLVKIGGNKFDDIIKNIVRKEYNLHIGSKSAEALKMQIADLKRSGEKGVVYGRNVASGLPVECAIDPVVLEKGLNESFLSITDNVKDLLESTPPEIGANIYKSGIYITGGGSLVSNLCQNVANGTGLKVNTSDAAESSVIFGLAEIIRNKKYRNLIFEV
ncbi:MAG: rod shape-determining protein [Lachnospiraceae bacterium]|nr:rod shape-determining protein [Lachnospiraceae bacterium]MBP5564091.1 rod shape-determining protein [Lachnospiraceae bacterium]MCR4697552.1 rod shape-determining protein [Lachnospiraceae bacterium]